MSFVDVGTALQKLLAAPKHTLPSWDFPEPTLRRLFNSALIEFHGVGPGEEVRLTELGLKTAKTIGAGS